MRSRVAVTTLVRLLASRTISKLTLNPLFSFPRPTASHPPPCFLMLMPSRQNVSLLSRLQCPIRTSYHLDLRLRLLLLLPLCHCHSLLLALNSPKASLSYFKSLPNFAPCPQALPSLHSPFRSFGANHPSFTLHLHFLAPIHRSLHYSHLIEIDSNPR